MEKLFSREGVTSEEATRGKIGIPCVLNMYENYPFWHRFFTELGFEVVISAKSSKRTFEDGLETIPSEAVCYPAKLVHGHFIVLFKQGVKRFFTQRSFMSKKRMRYSKTILTVLLRSGNRK